MATSPKRAADRRASDMEQKVHQASAKTQAGDAWSRNEKGQLRHTVSDKPLRREAPPSPKGLDLIRANTLPETTRERSNTDELLDKQHHVSGYFLALLSKSPISSAVLRIVDCFLLSSPPVHSTHSITRCWWQKLGALWANSNFMKEMKPGMGRCVSRLVLTLGAELTLPLLPVRCWQEVEGVGGSFCS